MYTLSEQKRMGADVDDQEIIAELEAMVEELESEKSDLESEYDDLSTQVNELEERRHDTWSVADDAIKLVADPELLRARLEAI